MTRTAWALVHQDNLCKGAEFVGYEDSGAGLGLSKRHFGDHMSSHSVDKAGLSRGRGKAKARAGEGMNMASSPGFCSHCPCSSWP